MRRLLDELDPLFAAAAVAIAGITLIAHMPHPPLLLRHPPLEMPASISPRP